MSYKIGVDLGGTKTEVIALEGDTGRELYRHRVPTDRRQYRTIIQTIVDLVADAEAQLGQSASVGVGIPGSIDGKTGLVKNSNSTVTNAKPMGKDLCAALQREVRLANDANCLALSEAKDGAAKEAKTVFAVIIGTGCGGGLVADGKILEGANGLGGEWGHNPLPFPKMYTPNSEALTEHFMQTSQPVAEIYRHLSAIEYTTQNLAEQEYPGSQCYCGKRGCLETWISGTGFAQDYWRTTGEPLNGVEIVAQARAGQLVAVQVLERYTERLAKALAQVINTFDPEAIVLGGGMSNVDEIYQQVPLKLAKYVFADQFETPILKAVHGDSSGVRGAAWLW